MKPVRALLLYLAVVLLGAALVSPMVWHGVQAIGPDSSLAHQPFHRYVNRCLLGLALAGLWPLLRALRANSWRSIGADQPTAHVRDWLRGIGYGWGSLGLAALITVLAGARIWNPAAAAPLWFRHLGTALGSALLVSVLEELLFRGAVYSALRRAGSFAWAAALSSGLYAFVHFFQRPPSPTVITATSGFTTLGRMLAGFMDVRELIPGWLTLTLAGWLLARARERTGHIWFGVGLHAGWIFWLKAYGFATTATGVAVAGSFWGSSRLYDGWLSLLVLASVGVVLHRRRPASAHHEQR